MNGLSAAGQAQKEGEWPRFAPYEEFISVWIWGVRLSFPANRIFSGRRRRGSPRISIQGRRSPRKAILLPKAEIGYVDSSRKLPEARDQGLRQKS